MKEMIYMPKRLDPPRVLLDEKVGKYRILILNYGTHPCGCVGVPLGHPLAGFVVIVEKLSMNKKQKSEMIA